MQRGAFTVREDYVDEAQNLFRPVPVLGVANSHSNTQGQAPGQNQGQGQGPAASGVRWGATRPTDQFSAALVFPSAQSQASRNENDSDTYTDAMMQQV